MDQVIVCRFEIRDTADPDEFEKSLGAALSRQEEVGSTRSGQLTGFRLLRGAEASTERTYLLEVDGMMSLPAGIRDAITSGSADAIVGESFHHVGSPSA